MPLFGLSMEVTTRGRQSLPWLVLDEGPHRDRHGHQRHRPWVDHKGDHEHTCHVYVRIDPYIIRDTPRESGFLSN